MIPIAAYSGTPLYQLPHAGAVVAGNMLIDYKDANEYSFETNTYTTIIEQRLISLNLSTTNDFVDLRS